MSGRCWIFTLNNPTPEEDPKRWPHKYLVYQLEKGEEGTLHYQGYIHFEKVVRISALKKINARAHWEPRRGTHEQAKAYCTKEESRQEGPWELGEEPQQGKRKDLEEVKTKIKEGMPLLQIAEDHYSNWCRYRSSFAEYKRMITPQRDFKTQVAVIWGPTGVGKSRYVAEKAEGDIYWKSDSKWWDGYENQTHVCLDDFYGWIKYHDMLRLLDRYPYQVEFKGGHLQFNSKFIWITSNKHPRDWYKDMSEEKYAALKRRFDIVVHMTEEGQEEEE